MTAPYPYRVRGKGRHREIFSGERLVGLLHGNGETWTGWRPDGTLVRDATGAVVRSPTIARWRTPDLWRNP